MTKANPSAVLSRIENVLIEEMLQVPDSELLQSIVDRGEDPRVVANAMRQEARAAIAAVRRERLDNAKKRLKAASGSVRMPAAPARPPLEKIKQVVLEVFGNNADLGLAFRNGKKQSDKDWESLYDDLVAMGEVEAGQYVHR